LDLVLSSLYPFRFFVLVRDYARVHDRSSGAYRLLVVRRRDQTPSRNRSRNLRKTRRWTHLQPWVYGKYSTLLCLC
jgi:hypothetical protein